MRDKQLVLDERKENMIVEHLLSFSFSGRNSPEGENLA
jgi:hypothetical protein